MATKLILVLAICVLAAVAYAEEEELIYSDKYDFVDVDGIIKNDRLRNQYFLCFMDKAPCLTPDAKFFKDKLPEALVTKCKKCTKKQHYMFEKIIIYYTEKEPENWTAIIAHSVEKYSKKKKL